MTCMQSRQLSENAVRTIIREYTREAGVRNLEREIATICRKTAREVVNDRKHQARVSNAGLSAYLGIPRFHWGSIEKENEVGVATGLAWTEAGGDVLSVEVSILKGKGNITLTGKLGDVKQHWPTLAEAVGTLRAAGAWISLAHPWQYNFTGAKRRRLVADFIQAGGHALEVVNGLQPAEQVGSLAVLAREFGMLVSAGSDFHAPCDWSDLGMYRPLPDDLPPIWGRFRHAHSPIAAL